MDRATIISQLNTYRTAHAADLGIRRIGIFGSVATGAATPTSDVDVVVDLDRPDYSALARIKYDLESLFGCPVDVVRRREGMNPLLRTRIDRDAVYA